MVGHFNGSGLWEPRPLSLRLPGFPIDQISLRLREPIDQVINTQNERWPIRSTGAELAQLGFQTLPETVLDQLT